jgi:hypothetical protein
MKSSDSGLKNQINGRADPLRDTPLLAEIGTNFADKQRPLCRYISLGDQ